MIVFSTEAYTAFGDALAQAAGYDRGAVGRNRFPDGELYQRVATSADDRDVVLVGGTISDADTLELYDLACGLVDYGARRLALVMPFFGYSTMERSVREGEVVTAKARARLLSSIPVASMGNRALLLDLHVSGLTHYFEGALHPVHLYGKPVIAEAARQVGGEDFVLACTDAGRAKWVESLANDLGVTAAFVYKRRLSGDETVVTGVSAHVDGRPVVIYDDMIRTGSSVINAARAYLDAGATRVAALCTHGVFPGDSLAKLEGSGLLTQVICTNSHPRVAELESPFLKVVDCMPLFADCLRRIR